MACLFLLLLRHWCCSFHPSKDLLQEREREKRRDLLPLFVAGFSSELLQIVFELCLHFLRIFHSTFSVAHSIFFPALFFFFSLRWLLFQPSWNREWFSFFLVVVYDFFSNLLLLSWQLPNLFLEDSTSFRQNLMSSAFLLCNGACLQLLHRSPPISSGASSYIKRTTRGKLHTHSLSLSNSCSKICSWITAISAGQTPQSAFPFVIVWPGALSVSLY